MRPPPAILPPGAEVLGYTVERQLGQGGFGTAYLARLSEATGPRLGWPWKST
ncbi:hypothetical protein COEX109129_25595 [Corallococcus exiguus]